MLVLAVGVKSVMNVETVEMNVAQAKLPNKKGALIVVIKWK